jgi:protein O-mannosyl-transferase
LSPVSNIFFPTGILLAERTLFLPSVGLALVVAGLVDALPRWRTPVLGLAAVLIMLGGLRSRSRVVVWRDQETFYRQLVIDGARSYRSWYAAAGYASGTGDHALALHHYGVAWKLEQRDFRVAEEYGQALRTAGRYDEAIGVLQRGFSTQPNHEPLTSRLLESFMSAGRWVEGQELIAKVAELSEEDATRLQHRFDVAWNRAQHPTP